MLNIKNAKELDKLVEEFENKEEHFDVDKFICKFIFAPNGVDGEILNKANLRVQTEYLIKRLNLLKEVTYFSIYKLTEEEKNEYIKAINNYIESLDFIIKAIKFNEQERFIKILNMKDLNDVQALAQERVNNLVKKYGIKVDIVDCYANSEKSYRNDNGCSFYKWGEKQLNEIYWNDKIDWIDLKQLKMKLSVTKNFDEKNELLIRNIDFIIAHEYGHLIIDKYNLLNNRELQHIYYNTDRRGFREYSANNFEEFLADCFAYSMLDKEDRLKVADTFISKINEIVCK